MLFSVTFNNELLYILLFFIPLFALVLLLLPAPDSLNQFTSIFCLMVMSIDRYLAVVHPIRSTKWRKPFIAKLINLTVWGVSLLVILPTMIFSGLNKVPVCGIEWPEPKDIYYKAFIFYTFFIGFFLPLAVICLCYLLIIIKVSLSTEGYFFHFFHFQCALNSLVSMKQLNRTKGKSNFLVYSHPYFSNSKLQNTEKKHSPTIPMSKEKCNQVKLRTCIQTDTVLISVVGTADQEVDFGHIIC